MKKRASKRSGKSISEKGQKALTEIVELADEFCNKFLNEEYREFCEDMAWTVYEQGLPIESGKSSSWAGGIVHALGWINFLHDPSQTPHMSSPKIAEGFGVSQQTMLTKSKIIRDELDLIQLDPEWCLPSLIKDNPLVWMLSVNGFVMDIRMAPREMQEQAYQQGLIPYIPADLQEPELESDTEPNVLKFPSRQNNTSRPKSPDKPEYDGPTLFDGLKQ